MHAALVEDFQRPPRYGETPRPTANEREVLLHVRGAALSNLIRGQANGSHYSSLTTLPFTPGNDGVGIDPDGNRFYFIGPRAPFGSMAEYTVVPRAMTLPVPANLDDAVAAAMGNPGLATWGSLLGRAKFQAGEAVLINGATGVAGKQAIQVAKFLGASKIIVTGRNPEALAELHALGATETISLHQPEDALMREFRAALHDAPTHDGAEKYRHRAGILGIALQRQHEGMAVDDAGGRRQQRAGAVKVRLQADRLGRT